MRIATDCDRGVLGGAHRDDGIQVVHHVRAADLAAGTHISAVGADSPGKQELASDILRRASLLLVDSRRQCAMLGELQHAPDQAARAIEIGEFCDAPAAFDSAGITVADFTGLGVEDLYIAESCYLGAL